MMNIANGGSQVRKKNKVSYTKVNRHGKRNSEMGTGRNKKC